MHYFCHLSIHISSYFYASLIVRFIIGFFILIWDFLGENVVVQRNSPSLVFSTWSFIESQIRVYRKIENNTRLWYRLGYGLGYRLGYGLGYRLGYGLMYRLGYGSNRMHKNLDGYTLNHTLAYTLDYTLFCTHIYFIIIIEHLKLCQPKE